MHKKDKHTEHQAPSKASVNEPSQGAAPATEASAQTDAAPESSAPGAESVEQLKAEAAKAKEHWDRLLRTQADFENYRKRVTRERQEASKYAFVPLFHKLIPVLDSLDAAMLVSNSGASADAQSLREGLSMIHQQLRGALQEAGLAEIDATGQLFDHNWHEAVAQQPSADVPEGQVLQQLRKGYKCYDRLLRAATVIVAAKPPPEPETCPPAQSNDPAVTPLA